MKPISIDIDDLALARNQHNSEFLHVLDLRTGRIHMVEEFGGDLTDDPDPEEDDDEDWVDGDPTAGTADDPAADDDDDDDPPLPPPPSPDDVPTALEIANYPDLFILIEPRETHVAFRDMEEFVDTLQEGEPRRALARALRLPRPFRSFKDSLYDFPNERDAWFAFSEDRQRADAIEWLEERKIEWSKGKLPH